MGTQPSNRDMCEEYPNPAYYDGSWKDSGTRSHAPVED
jgi:3-mercaptopyruvate sulfurtransferase SseA